ncbi:MAG TPA: hypothetical protein PKE45_12285, partial [Caldilineaceae bacterium]|nr:hypothetical protein [Caldilineaceae bacterium]
MQFRSRSRFEVRIRSALLVLILAAFGWRLQALTVQSLWRDEVDAIYFALRNLPDTLAMFLQAGQNGPLYFLALRPWFYLAGASEFALRFPSAVFGTLSIPLLYQVARLLLAGWLTVNIPADGDSSDHTTRPSIHTLVPLVPLLAAGLLAVNPYQLWYSQEGKMYTLVTALSLTATWCWLVGITRGGWRPWLSYLLTVSIAIYSHLLMILLIPLHLVWFVIAWPQSKAHWRGYGLALAGLTLPYLPMVWWQWDLLLAADKRTGFSFTPLLPMVRTLILNHSRGFLPDDNLLLLAPLFFLALAGLVLGMTELPAKAADSSRCDLQFGAVRRWLLLTSWL